MPDPRILLTCVKMHRASDKALSGNFVHCLKLIEAMEQLKRIELYVHVDEQTLPHFEPIVPRERLVIENRSVDSIVDMERCIYRAIRRLRPDLYHKPTGQLPLLPIPCKAVWGVADLGFRHLAMGKIQRLYKRISYQRSARRADRILAASHSTRAEVIQALAVSSDKVQTVHHGTTRFGVDPEPVPNLPENYVITFAHHRHKNVETVIESVAIARSQGTDLRLIVIGSLNYRDELEEVAAANSMQDFIRYTGHVSDGQLRYLYENAMCLGFLSRHEGFGFPPIEAMGAGCPVISSDAFSLPEVVGDAAPILDCDDASGVATELTRFANDSSYRDSWISKGYENVKRFSWEKAASETIDAYEVVLQSEN